MRRTALAAMGALAALAGVVPVVAAPASARAGGDEARFVALINELRAGKGLAPMIQDPTLAATSCTWTDHMAATATLAHDPNLGTEIAAAEPVWTKAGENVGVGGDVTSLFQAFVASPGHYRNLVDPAFTRIGVCVTWMPDGVRMYTTQRFVATGSASPVTAPARPLVTAPPHPPATPVALTGSAAPSAAPSAGTPAGTRAGPPGGPPPAGTPAGPTVPIGHLVPFASSALAAGVRAVQPPVGQRASTNS